MTSKRRASLHQACILPLLRGTALSSVALLLMTALPVQAADLPTGGQITAGSGTIAASGPAMTVTQDTAKMVADWQSFSIGHGHSVNFVQPSADAVALNRVLGSDVSVIQGALTANGKLFLVNPNGVLFTPDAQVNAGGIVASTLDLKTADFLSGNYTFAGDSAAAIINRGHIEAADGFVALIAATIINEGSVAADNGAVLAGAGSRVTLDLGGPVRLDVEEGALDTLIEQGGAIRAAGGRVFLTARAAGDLATSVINHTGITEAQTLVTGGKGEIILLGDMAQGTLNIGGILNAAAPAAGDGGFIETSAAHVNIAEGTAVFMNAAHGGGGTWLIDPYNYVVDGAAAATISGALNAGGAVIIDTASDVAGHGSSGNGGQGGDITVNAAIQKTSASASSFTMNAHRDIALNADITSTNGVLNLTFNADSDRDNDGAITVNANLATRGGNINFGSDNTYSVGTSFGGAGTRTITALGNATVTFHGDVVLSTDLTIGGDGGTSGASIIFNNTVNSANVYTLSGGTANWATARTLAEGAGGYLATITSALENSMVRTATGGADVWLGATRTGNEWNWKTGPEGAENSGQGLAFYDQGTGITPAGAYSNWTNGEPNASGTGMQMWYNGGIAKWDDIPDATSQRYIIETAGTPRNLTIGLGSSAGSVTFADAVGKINRLNVLNVDAGAGGAINVNGGHVRTELAQIYAQDVSLGAAATTMETVGTSTDFTLTPAWTFTNASGGDAALTIKSARSVIMDSGSALTSPAHKMDVTLWADSDASGGGFIWMKASGGVGASIDTNGGNITLSGGTSTATGYAEGVNGIMGNGILLDAATLESGGGNIVLRGRSSTTATSVPSTDTVGSSNTDGIRLHGGNTIDSGTGTISLTGVARGTTGSSNGIETNQTGHTKIISASTSATAVSLYGDATAGSSANGWGTFLWGTDTSGIVLAATGAGGGISLNGLGRNTANGGGTHLEPNAFILAADGPIAITGTKGAASTYEDIVVNSTIGYIASLPAHFGFASPVTASASDIALTADTFSANRVFGTGLFTGSAVQSTGTLTIAPRTNGRAMTIQTTNPGAGPLWINPASMFGGSGLFKTGFSKFIFGNGTTGNVTLDNYSFDNDTEINTAGTATLGAVTIAGNDLIVNVTGGGAVTDSGALTLKGLKLNASTSAVTLDSAANAIGTVAADAASLAITNGNILSIGSVEGMDGLNATGLINVATLTGNLTLSKNITTTSTASNAVTLNAGKNSAAGTASGGNIIISGTPVITMGAGGRATLFTGSVNGSIGLAPLAGAGHYRYNSDEAAANYTTALGAGTYAIYREAPVITVQAGSVTKAFDGVAYSGAPTSTVTGFVNGETDSVLNGTLTYGGTAIGASLPGAYEFTVGGLANDLGYTINNVDGTLTITTNTPSPPQQAAQQAAQIIPVPPPLPTPVAPSLPPATPQTGNPANGPLTVGTMEVVQISSAEQPATADFDFAHFGGNAGIADFLKVFVVDGGIRIPGGTYAITAHDDEQE